MKHPRKAPAHRMVLSVLMGILASILPSLLVGCAKERPVRAVSSNPYRVSKKSLEGPFLFLKSIGSVTFNDTSHYPELMTGKYLQSDRIVEIQFTSTHARIVSTLPLFKTNGEPKSTLLAEIPVQHVDILRRETADGKKTHIEERDQSRRPWNEREYVEFDLSEDLAEELNPETTSVIPGDGIHSEAGSFRFAMERTLKDATHLKILYSLVPYQPNTQYEARPYSRADQKKFGFFKTSVYRYDGHQRITQSTTFEYLNRWDLKKPIVLYLSAGFPSALKPAVREGIDAWNAALKDSTGRAPLELRENSGQELGDLRYNMIHYDEGLGALKSVAFAPGVVHPVTGEILKSDLILFGGAIRRAIFRERCWEEQIDQMVRNSEIDSASLGKTVNIGQLVLPAFNVPELDSVARRSTSIEDAVSIPLRDTPGLGQKSDEQLEIEILKPLIVHELGHFLGLRHNFMGSADSKGNERSSSAMDYGFLTLFEPNLPGRYDRAALQFAYADKTPEESFLYCTDEQAYNAKYGRCLPYDAGRTLTDIATSVAARYQASYSYKNLRAEATHFEFNLQDYVSRTGSFLLPLRTLLDHTSAIIEENNRLSRIDSGSPEESAQVERLWALLQGRIERTANSDLNLVVKYPISGGRELELDRIRLNAAMKDVVQAQKKVFSVLESLIRNTQRPDHNHRDLWDDRMMTIGILPDKLIGLQILGLDGDHPLDDLKVSPLQSSIAEDIWKLFVDVLSNTAFEKNKYETKAFDPNLRNQILSLIERASKPGHGSAWFLELIHLRDKTPGDDALLNEIAALRAQYRALLKKRAEDDLPEVESKKLDAEIEKTWTQLHRPELNLASFKLSETQTLVAPLTLENGWETATGRLIRDNLNIIEDKLIALNEIIQQSEQELGATRNPLIRNEIQKTLTRNRREQTRILGYLEIERRFVMELFNVFQGKARTPAGG